jgi:uncharacterized protein (DUF58 family)
MFFSAVWFYGAVALLILGMATRQPALTVLATLILLTAGVSWLWNRYSLHAVTYGRRLGSTRVFRGETLALRLELVNRKLLPLAWIEVEDEFADRLETVDRRATPASNPTRMILPYLTSLRPYERVAWTATLRCPARGAFTFGPVMLRSGDIFGFYRQNLRLHLHDSIIVYPRIEALPDIGIPPRGAFGDVRVRQALLLDPLRTVGTRDYRPEDSFRHIHWKATARAQTLQVRVFGGSQPAVRGWRLFQPADQRLESGAARAAGQWPGAVTAHPRKPRQTLTLCHRGVREIPAR